MIVNRRAEMGEAGFKHYLRIQVEQRRQQAALDRATATRKLAEAQENVAVWSALRARLPAAPAVEPLQLVLPSGPSRAQRPDQDRRARYRAHLQRATREAAALASDDPAVMPAPVADTRDGEGAHDAKGAPSPLPGRLCALCGGGCCTRGSDHAYLLPATLRRFMDAHPQMSVEEVVAEYDGRVAAETQSGSCINHTRGGCSLPREMRSDTCNVFACESLVRLQAAQADADPVRIVLVVRRRQDQWLRGDPRLDNAINARAILQDGQRSGGPR